jgi:hypothetical protein
MAESESQDIAGTIATTRGSFITTQHTERSMKLYGVYEGELNALALFNSITVAFASLGTGFLSFGVAQWIELTKGPASDHAEVVGVICWFCAIGALVSYGIAVWAFFYRHSALSKILAESKPVAN